MPAQRVMQWGPWLLLLLVLATLTAAPAQAEPLFEFGAGLQSGWSGHEHLQNPAGWYLFAARKLGTKAALRLSYSDFSNSHDYRGTLYSGFVPFVDSLQNRLIHSDVAMRYVELTLHHQLVASGNLSLDAGAGVGLAEFRASLTDVGYGDRVSPSHNGAMATVLIGFSVQPLFDSPVALRMGYQYRTSPAQADYATDSVVPLSLDGLSLSAVQVSLLAAF